MRAMGRNPTEAEIMGIMNEIDVDHNGKNFIVVYANKYTSKSIITILLY